MARLVLGLAVAIATWLAVRRALGGGWRARRLPALLMLDAAPPLLGFVLFLLPTGRPLLAALGIAALGFGLIIADREKRAILAEPVVFADRAELIEVVRHPRLYLAFVGIPAAIAIAAGIAAVLALLVWLEPPLWPVGLGGFALWALAALILGRLCFVLPGLVAKPLAGAYARFGATGDPEADMARLGPFATFIVHATTARAERAPRQQAARARSSFAVPAGQGPIVLIQGESFVDGGRLEPSLAGRLPHFTALKRDAAASGALAVPCWGANTIRSELAVLAGLDAAALGLDRFNPYEAFAHAPLPTLASAARASGYRTIFVHPYDRTFYARHKVTACLGFDQFIGLEGFAGAPTDAGYVTDAAVAEKLVALIREHGPNVFLFAVTMENHGPWNGKHDPLPPAPLPPAWSSLADAEPVGRWLRHLQATDAMIAPLRAELEALGLGWLGFYGDHQPSLAGPFHAPGAPDRRTDYALWSPRAAPGARRDLSADEVAATLGALMAGG